MNKGTLHLVALDSKIKINKFGKGGNTKNSFLFIQILVGIFYYLPISL